MRVDPIKDNKLLRKIINDLKESGNERNLILILFGLYTGLRISDILNLKVKDVKGKRTIRIRERKTGRYKSIEIHKELKKELDKYCLNKRLNEYLIKSRQGENRPISRVQAYRIMKDIQYKYKINENIGCHSLRKTLGYNLNKENDISLVQKALNHKSTSNTLRYIGVEEEEINKAISKLKYY